MTLSNKERVITILENVLCENVTHLDMAAPLREQLEIDSMDLLDLLLNMQKEFGVTINPKEIHNIVSLNDVLAQLEN